MSEKLKYKRDKCLICGEFNILKNDICIECDGGDEFVNKLYKFLRNLETKVIYDKNHEKLMELLQSYENHGWISMSPITFDSYGEEYGWCFRTVVIKEK